MATERPRVANAVLAAASFLFVLDGMAVNVALPSIQRELGLSTPSLQWVISAYTLPFGGLLLLGGRLGDLLGQRRMLIGGLGVFAVGLVTAGLARSPGVLLAGRALQGVGAAASAPAALALISATFPAGPLRDRAVAVNSMWATLAAVSGAVLGGVITATLGWPWIFFLGVPVAAAAALGAPAVLPERRDERGAPRPDAAGALAGTGGLLALVFALASVERDGPGSLAVLAPLAAAVALLVAFVAHERRTASPLVRPGILRAPGLVPSAFGIFANSATYTGVVFLSTLYLQRELGYGALEAGLAFVPMSLAGAVSAAASARLLRRRTATVVGAAFLGLSALALLLLARTPDDGTFALDVLPGFLLIGLGVSGTYVPLTAAAGREVGDEEKGTAYGVFETCTHVGGTFAVALLATLVAVSGLRLAYLAAAAVAASGAYAVRASAARSASKPG